MCVVSMTGDFYHQKWQEPYYQDIFKRVQEQPATTGGNSVVYSFGTVTRQEFDALKKEVEDMKKLLELALEYDKKNNEPHCEVDEKMETLKKVAELFGVDLSGLLTK